MSTNRQKQQRAVIQLPGNYIQYTWQNHTTVFTISNNNCNEAFELMEGMLCPFKFYSFKRIRNVQQRPLSISLAYFSLNVHGKCHIQVYGELHKQILSFSAKMSHPCALGKIIVFVLLCARSTNFDSVYLCNYFAQKAIFNAKIISILFQAENAFYPTSFSHDNQQ